ncbi:14-3-3 superfamily protein [Cystoisospora suis]|uniref:14-3-3 superfamily protein n=1 Tax=Cystoisospora suis TaxID=483139 RepID=A0A2C6KQI5_9APIC|nr:14-3-3 superfamily protein [Cystoisospora suis]
MSTRLHFASSSPSYNSHGDPLNRSTALAGGSRGGAGGENTIESPPSPPDFSSLHLSSLHGSNRADYPLGISSSMAGGERGTARDPPPIPPYTQPSSLHSSSSPSFHPSSSSSHGGGVTVSSPLSSAASQSRQVSPSIGPRHVAFADIPRYSLTPTTTTYHYPYQGGPDASSPSSSSVAVVSPLPTSSSSFFSGAHPSHHPRALPPPTSHTHASSPATASEGRGQREPSSSGKGGVVGMLKAHPDHSGDTLLHMSAGGGKPMNGSSSSSSPALMSNKHGVMVPGGGGKDLENMIKRYESKASVAATLEKWTDVVEAVKKIAGIQPSLTSSQRSLLIHSYIHLLTEHRNARRTLDSYVNAFSNLGSPSSSSSSSRSSSPSPPPPSLWKKVNKKLGETKKKEKNGSLLLLQVENALAADLGEASSPCSVSQDEGAGEGVEEGEKKPLRRKKSTPTPQNDKGSGPAQEDEEEQFDNGEGRGEGRLKSRPSKDKSQENPLSSSSSCMSPSELQRKKEAREMDALRVVGGGGMMSLEPLKRYQPFFLFCVELYRQRIAEDMTALTDEIDKLAVTTLLPNAENPQAEAAFQQLRGDSSRHAAQMTKNESVRKRLEERALHAYEAGIAATEKGSKEEGCVVSALRLGIILNYAVLLKDVDAGRQSDKAIDVLAAEFRKTIENMYQVTNEDDYQRILVVLGLMRDNIESWCAETGRTDVPLLLGFVQYQSQSSLTSFSEGSAGTDHPNQYARHS